VNLARRILEHELTNRGHHGVTPAVRNETLFDLTHQVDRRKRFFDLFERQDLH
jgi:hypothetical protein